MRILVRGGDVVDTEPEPVVHAEADVLIEDGRIAAVGRDLPADGTEIIDATGRIVLPGFVDTHRHLWVTTLRGHTADMDLSAYIPLVLREIAGRYRPADMHTATLAGALECLDAGVTTVQDYAHNIATPEHADAAATALLESGIRAVFGYGYPTFDPDAPRPKELRSVREEYFGDGLLTMALAPLGPAYAPIEQVERDWRLAAELDLPIVVHIGVGPASERPVDALRQRRLLRAGVLYVHGNTLPDEELALIADSGGAVAATPAVEELMDIGPPVIRRLRAAGVTTGLGVDVVTTVAGDMFSVMRAAQLTGRVSVAEALRMATLEGARALGLGEEVGSLRPGKQADLVLLRTDAPNMVGALDPIAAAVTAAHPGNVDTVLVAGRVVKRNGRLLRSVPVEEVRAVARHVLGR